MEAVTSNPHEQASFPKRGIPVLLKWFLVFGVFLIGGSFLLEAMMRTDIIETLESPVTVRSWDDDVLLLADGRAAKLPGIAQLPSKDSPILGAATKRGVQLAPDGRVYGLIKVHHWCGNDPVRNHIAKIDLSRLLLFVGEGKPIKPVSKDLAECQIKDPSVGEWGWRMGEYLQFKSWNELHDQGVVRLFQDK